MINRLFLIPLLAMQMLMTASTAASMSEEPAQASSRPILIELFTSQGCANCPSANRFLSELAAREEVIALSFAVDYWDYLGWKDTFAMDAFSRRQKQYQMAMHARRPYTPQMILQGQSSVIGTKKNKINKMLRNLQKSAVPGPSLNFTRKDNQLLLRIQAGKAPENGALIWIADYEPGTQKISILAGENQGKRIDQVNMVTKLHKAGLWQGDAMELSLPAPETGSCIVIIQEAGPGAVLAVAKLQTGPSL